jgi:glucose/mannose transport system permease protein
VAASVETAVVGTARFWRVLIYTTLIVFAIMYLLPLFVMVVTSFKTLDEVHEGHAAAAAFHDRGLVIGLGHRLHRSDLRGISGYFWNSIRWWCRR